MPIFQRWRRDTVCLGVGVLAGVIAVAFAGRSQGKHGQAVAPPPLGMSSAQAASSPTPAAIADPADAPRLPRQGKAHAAAKAPPAWEQAVAAYLATDTNPLVARNLMLQLSPKALGKLAHASASWPNTPRNQRALGEIFRHLGEIDPLNALAQTQTLSPAFADLATFNAMAGFIASNPEEATAYFSAPPSDDVHGYLHNLNFRQAARSGALVRWAEDDPAAATAYMAGLPAKSMDSGRLDEIAANWAQHDPAAAMNWANHLPDQDEHHSALQGVVSTWTQTDPQAAANYVLGAGGPLQKDLVETLVHSWSDENLADAARWTLAQTGTVQTQAADTLASRWSRNDPAGAAAWAAQLPAGSARDEAFSSVASGWLSSDPTATESWLGGLTAGDARDAAIAGYATSWRNDANPADVLRRVQTIDDPTKQESTLVTVLNRWLGNNAQAAHQWISQASLPTTVTSKLNGG